MLEAILHFSIRNRWLVVLVTIIIAAVGINALTELPIDAVPDITNNQVQINVAYPALSPLEIEKRITFPIEISLAGIPGLQSTRSLSRNGFSQVTAIFDDDVDIYFARQQIFERLTVAKNDLPAGAEPTMGPISTGLGEIYMYTVEFEHPGGVGADVRDGDAGWQSDGAYRTPEGQLLRGEFEQVAYLREVQDWVIRTQLRTVKGIAGVDAIGGYVKQYQVQPDPMKLMSYGLTFHDVIDALEKNNINTGAGYIEHKGEMYIIRTTGRVNTLAEIADIVVGSRHGIPIHVHDIVAPNGVRIGRELRTGSASENGREIVVGTAIMRIGENSRTVAAAVDAKLEQIRKTLPADIRAKTVLDRTKLVDATIRTVERNLVEGAILVIAVLFVLLGNIRAALICALAIPLSMLIATIGMVKYKVSGNLMSLGAIDFGLIVDGAVIIVENCIRRLGEAQHAQGRLLTLKERLDVVFDGSKQVRSATAFGEAIITVVYIPILTLTGVEGKMFHPMAATVIFALAGAFVLSLTFVPAMVAIVMRGHIKEREVFLIRWAKSIYEPIVRRAIQLRWPLAVGSVVVFIASLALFETLGQEFIPRLDEKDLAMHALRIPSTSLSQSQEMQFDIERALGEFPEVAFVYSKTGTAEIATDPMPQNVTDTFVIFKPQNQWRSEAELEQLINAQAEENERLLEGHHEEHGEEHQHEFNIATHKGKLIKLIELTVQTLPGNNYEFSQPIEMRFNELIAGVRGDVAIKVFGQDFDKMRQSAEQILDIVKTIPGAADARVEQTVGMPVLTIDIDRNVIARYGLNVADVQEVVAVAIGGQEAGVVFEGDRRFDIVVRLSEELRGQPDAIANLWIPLPARDEEARDVQLETTTESAGIMPSPSYAGFLPLNDVARISVAEGTNQISRENGLRRVYVQCNVRGRDLGSFVAEAQEKVNAIALPQGQWLDWSGQFENLIAARRRLSVVVPICFLLIFVLLFSTFKSVRYAMLVFSAVPLGLSGGIAALWLRGMPFSISAAVGFIALSGVAVLNGLVMVTFINQLRQEGRATVDAIIQGSLTRFRPVLTTALVASLGFVPMAMSTGTGAEVQRPLATVVIGGLLTSTLLTLVVLPALYRIFVGKGE
ncbi:MAG TPA: CusA/CzcA family heavy metal efflux RND transporter [Phycisphaerae bacterium]|nr:CusA/CzcA family heavy metal efflux RND transporter [Phycisphaerae bacterium]